MTLRVVLQQDSETGDWAVWCPELPGCASAGDSREDALVNIREAVKLYFDQDPIELDSAAEIVEIAA